MIGFVVQSGPPEGRQPQAPPGGRGPGATVELDSIVCGSGSAGARQANAAGNPGVTGVSLLLPPGQSVALLSQPRDDATALFDATAGLGRPALGTAAGRRRRGAPARRRGA